MMVMVVNGRAEGFEDLRLETIRPLKGWGGTLWKGLNVYRVWGPRDCLWIPRPLLLRHQYCRQARSAFAAANFKEVHWALSYETFLQHPQTTLTNRDRDREALTRGTFWVLAVSKRSLSPLFQVMFEGRPD